MLVSSNSICKKYGLSGVVLEKYSIFFGGTTESGKFSRDLFIFDFGELNAPLVVDFKVGLNCEKKI